MKNAVSSNWVAETCEVADGGFALKGTSKGYASFSEAFNAGDQVFYSAHDSQGNREAGYATFDGTALVDREITASLVNGVYTKSPALGPKFDGDVTVACTFNAVAFNVLWKALDAIDPDGDGNINIPPELIDGLIEKLDTKAEQADLEQEIQDRIDGDKALQDQIDALDPDGDRKVDWSEIEGKPSEFPPEAHNQDWGTITGKPADYPPSAHNHAWDQVTGKPTEFPPSAHNHAWDQITGKPSEFPPEAHNQDWSTITNTPSEYPPEDHTHSQSEVDGLEDRLTSIEGSISSGGGFVDAPNDGKLYGRQSEAWAEVPSGGASSWNDLTDKPTEFPPEAHTHTTDEITGLNDELDEIKGDITDLEGAVGELTGQLAMGGSYDASTGLVVTANLSGFTAGQPLPDYSTVPNTFVIVTVAGNNPEELGEADWLVAGQSGWVAIKYGTAGSVDWDNIQNVPTEFPPESHQHGWDQITGKPSDYPPSAHNHDGVYQPVGDYIGEAPNDGEEYARKNKGWVKLQDHNYTGADAVKLTGDQSVAGHKTWTDVATFVDTVTLRGTLNGDDTANFQNAVTAGSFVKTGGTSSQYLMADGSVSTGGTGGGGESLWTQNGDDIYYNDGSVGIGTDNPSQALHIQSLGSSAQILLESTNATNGQIGIKNASAPAGFYMGLLGDTSGDAILYHGDAKNMRFYTAAEERVTLDAQGNVGIGTDNPKGKVGVLGGNGDQLFLDNSGERFTQITLQNNGVTKSSWSYDTQDTSANIYSSDNLSFFTGGDSTTAKVKIDENGNVGIGDDNPSSPLSIKNSGWAGIRLESSNENTAVGGRIEFEKTGKTIGTNISGSEEGIKFFTGNDLKAIIDAAGNVGIGTDNPADLLHLNGSAPGLVMSEGGAVAHYRNRAAASALVWDVLNTDNTRNFEAMRIDAEGNVGIGTDSPIGNLHVKGPSADIVTSTVSTDDVQLRFSAYQDQHAEIRVNTAHDLLFKTNGNEERMRIDAQGRVGIGIQDTIYPLAVKSTAAIVDPDISTLSFAPDATSGATPGYIQYDQASDNLKISAYGANQSLASMSFEVGGNNERVRIDASGKVGINNQAPYNKLDIKSSPTSPLASAESQLALRNADGRATYFTFDNDADLTVYNTGNNTGGGATIFHQVSGEAMRIANDGRVGIGGEPGTRTIDEAKALAKTKLAEWKAEVKKRTAEQPEASTQEITLEVTDGDFGVMPTEEALAEFLQGRAIGGADALLQVAGSVAIKGPIFNPGNGGITFANSVLRPTDTAGVASSGDNKIDIGTASYRFKDAFFSGAVQANWYDTNLGITSASKGTGLQFTSSSILPVEGSFTQRDAQIDLGNETSRFKDGHFSGTIYGTVDDVPAHVKAITPTQIANWDAGTGGGGGGATTDGRISDTQITNWDSAYGWGNHASVGYLTSASLSGYATESWVNSQGFAKGSFVPTSGNSTISGTLTATDFIASSDERLKDDISPMPVGLIDDIKPVQWTWKDSGKKSAGVIAQQLQEIGLDDFVTEGEDGMLGVNYNALVSVLLAEVISLKKELAK